MTAVDAARLAGSATELARALRAWLPQQRWFAGKARTITGVEVSDLADLAGDLVLVVAEVTFADGGSQRYAVPLVAGGSGDAVAEVVGTALTDAVADTEACRALARLALRPERTPTTSGGVLVGRPLGRDGVTSLEAAIDGAVRPMGVEQSNSSVVFGDALVMKLLRRLEDGDNPEVELTRVLTQAAAPNVPAQRGFVELQGPDTGTAALAVLTDFVVGAREGWAVATAEAAEVARGGSGGKLVALMASLGAAVADIHTTLRDALGERQAARQAVERVVSGMHAQLDRVLTTARERAPEATAEVLAAGEQIRDALSRLGVIEIGPFTRVHGDLHLGQVLLDPDGRWQLLDFEGEPARPLADRAEPAPPLRDVAGMLRSFDYVAGHALLTDGAEADRLEAWRDELREAFLTGYLGRAAAGSLPGDETATRVVLDALELDKAVYELGYELANRPDWVAIPVGGIRRLLARTGAPTFQEVHMPTRASDSSSWRTDPRSVASLVAGRLGDPHEVLGAHDLAGGGAVVRAYRPEAESVEVVIDGRTVAATRTSDAGLFEAVLDERPTASGYRLRVRYPDGRSFDLYDPYSFWPTIGEIDLHLVGEGRHEELWRRMGAHVGEVDGVQGTSFAVWAPNASSVRVVAEFNSWDGRLHPMRMLGASGVWELFVPEVGSDTYYRYELVTADGSVQQRADPWAFATDVPPRTSSRVFDSSYEWDDAEWMGSRGERTSVSAPMSVYEVHLGSWRHRDHRSLTYRELADDLVGHVTYMGFTHVELLPAAEHPFGGSWGYQVTGYFAPSARFGDPDDFRYLVDRLHQAGIGVIVDWVPAHFPKDEWALARFDGTALYEHADPRQGEHPDWGTLVFNFGRNEVRNFLIANALYWLEELHVDGLRVDAVASMLYLDYSRQPGEWVPNAYGGRENLEAVSFLQELNRVVYARNPDVAIIAEESTAWPGVTRPVHLGGLGFGFKWNMGWMHDTLDYAAREPIHRRFHHNQMTFSLMYAFTENFVLPFSHDEVVHGKRSLIDKMPGDRWQKFANLRATYGYMWGHPGKQLLFMGSEFGQWREWSEVRELDWYLLDEADHQGLQRMVAALNARYRELPALWRRDAEPEGFTWIDANDADHNTFSFVRYGADADAPVAVVTNFSPVPRRQRIGLPAIARYWEAFNSDAAEFGGSGSGNLGEVWADDAPWHGMPASAEVTVPPLGTIWLART